MMRGSIYAIAAVALLVASPATAVEQFDGQGFDCFFQTGRQKLERLTVWYGGTRHKNDKSPQFEDASKLLILKGFAEGARMTFYVSDKWPDKFEFQYFQLDAGRTPLSLLSVYGNEKNAGSGEYRAEIVHLPANVAVGTTIQPVKRLNGMCSYNPAITLSNFRAGTKP